MIILLLWSALASVGSLIFQSPVNYVKTEVGEGITLKVPESFAPLPDNLMEQKYLSARKPIALYTNENQQVDVGVSTSNARWQANDLPMLQSFYRSNIMALYDEVAFNKEALEKVNGKDFAVFEFVSLVRPEEDALTAQRPIRKYTYIQYTIHNGKSYVFTFNCPAEQQSQWQEVAKTIMESVKISDTPPQNE